MKEVDERQIQSGFNFDLIREALSDVCNLINDKQSIFEKYLLMLVLLSYIQAFDS